VAAAGAAEAEAGADFSLFIRPLKKPGEAGAGMEGVAGAAGATGAAAGIGVSAAGLDSNKPKNPPDCFLDLEEAGIFYYMYIK
jgi:hypothetical protein